MSKGVNYVIRSTPPSVCRHFKNCVRQFSKTSWWKSFFIGFGFSTSITIGCNGINNASALSRCLILWKIFCASCLPYPKAIKNNFSSLPLFMFHAYLAKNTPPGCPLEVYSPLVAAQPVTRSRLCCEDWGSADIWVLTEFVKGVLIDYQKTCNLASHLI